MKNDFIKSLQGEVTERVPFWLMRQAGRYLPEYRELRGKAGSFMNLCFSPEYAAEVTLQPIRRFDMDAAILFSDILVVPYALGQDLSFVEGEGPKLSKYQSSDVLMYDDATLEPIYETIKLVRRDLDPNKALIGFAGAPWTVACYMVQGRGGGDFIKTRDYAAKNDIDFLSLIRVVADATAEYLIRQIESGVDALQIFDSWAGLCPLHRQEDYILEPTARIVAKVRARFPSTPIIGFPRGAKNIHATYLERTGVGALSLDEFYSIDTAVKEFGSKVTLQGNLSPAVLLEGGKTMQDAARYILGAAAKTPFIFNLGHGINKETPPEHVAALAKLIKDFQR